MPKQHAVVHDQIAPYTGQFSLSITDALGEQLMAALNKLPAAPLTLERISQVAREGGIYQLLLDGKSVYIGKSKDALNGRIGQHRRKLSGRTEGLLERMQFRALYVNEDLDALAPEKMLIRSLRRDGEAPWNQNGFGNNDPGRRRDTSLVKLGHFDNDYSINLGFTIKPVSVKPVKTLLDAMSAIKLALPYNLRFPSPKDASQRVLREIDVASEPVHEMTMSAERWLTWIAEHLPQDWMITAFPGYVIVYRERDPEVYGSRKQVWLPDGRGSFERHTHVPDFDPKDEIRIDEDRDDEDEEDDEN